MNSPNDPDAQAQQSQARTRNAKRRRIKPSRPLCHAVETYLRYRNEQLDLFYVAKSSADLLALRVAGLLPARIDHVAPWFHCLTDQEQQRENDAFRSFDATPESLRKLTGTTVEQLRRLARTGVRCGKGFSRCKKCRECDKRREHHLRYPMHALLQIAPLSPDELEQREDAKNDQRKQDRLTAREQQAARFSPTQNALVKAMKLILRQHGCCPPDALPVSDIIRNIEVGTDRTLFPREQEAFRAAVRHDLNRLERRGVVAIATSGKPGRKVRIISFALHRTGQGTPPVKSLIYQKLAGQKPDLGPWTWGHDEGAVAKGLGEMEVVASATPDQPASRPAVAPGDHHQERVIDTFVTEPDQPDKPVSRVDHEGKSIDHSRTLAGGEMKPPFRMIEPDLPPDEPQHRQDQHVDGLPIIENVNAAAAKERNDMTDEERLELAYLRQRITAFEKKFGVRADDPPPQPPVEPVGDNVIRLRRK